jgi:hypothetical protein
MELPTLIYSSKGTGRNSVWYSAALIRFGTNRFIRTLRGKID